MYLDYDVVIIGAGPAGLSCSNSIRENENQKIKVLLIDSGKSIENRDRYLVDELTHGHGGAGLFSDGKFSFYPSATSLWDLPQKEKLINSYNWCCDILNKYGLKTPPFPNNNDDFCVGNGEWILKEYPSDYISLENRIQMTSELVSKSNSEIINNKKITDIEYNSELDLFSISIENSNTITAKRIIFCTGRFGPIDLVNKISKKHDFFRLELGFRIEQNENKSFLKKIKLLDPKFRFSDENVEWRTFCSCRDGETALTNTLGLWTVSGRSDCPSTGKSNFGFNTRILNKEIYEKNIDKLLNSLKKKDSYYNLSMKKFIEGDKNTNDIFHEIYGRTLTEYMKKGLIKLINKFPELLDEETNLIGPTLEGIGLYPKLDDNLKLTHIPAWVSGDACGRFRGIVASMISGYYVGKEVINDIESYNKSYV